MTRQDDGNFEGHQEFSGGVEDYEWVNFNDLCKSDIWILGVIQLNLTFDSQ